MSVGGGVSHWQLASKGKLAGDCMSVHACWLRDELSLEQAVENKAETDTQAVNHQQTQLEAHTLKYKNSCLHLPSEYTLSAHCV